MPDKVRAALRELIAQHADRIGALHVEQAIQDELNHMPSSGEPEFDLALGSLLVKQANRTDPLELAEIMQDYVDRMHEKAEREAIGHPALS